MKIKKGTIKPFIKKLFTINSKNKGFVRGAVLASTVIYLLTNTYTHKEIKTIQENKQLETKKEENVVQKLFKININESAPLKILTEYKPDELKKYILNKLNSNKKLKIKKLLEEEVKNEIYKIDNVPVDVSKELAKSSILYNLAFVNKKRIFDNEKDIRKKIIYTEALLASVAQLETGGKYQFDHREFSKTNAYGRFQITATTAATIILKLYMEEGFKIQEKEQHVSSTFYSMLKTYTKDINKEYANKYNETWRVKEENKQLNKYLSYTRRLNYAYIKALDNNLVYMKDVNGNNSKIIKEKLFYSKGKLSKYKQFKFSLKVLDFLKTPENQGILSCFVLEEIYKRQKKDQNIEEAIYNTLKEYNGDKNKQLYQGTKQEIRKIYASKGVNYFNKYSSEVSEIKYFKKEENKNIKKEVSIKNLFASI